MARMEVCNADGLECFVHSYSQPHTVESLSGIIAIVVMQLSLARAKTPLLGQHCQKEYFAWREVENIRRR